MNKLMNFLVVCIVVDLCFSNYAFAQNFKKLDGSYAIASKTMSDPPPDEKKGPSPSVHKRAWCTRHL